MEDEHDLYGDIDETPVFSSAAAGGTAADNDTKSRPMSLVEENKFLREKVAKLQGENDVLQRNMGTLFRTATAEIQRKDKEILRLATELDKAAAARKSGRG